MRKLAAAALVLGLAGVAAAAAIGVHRFSCGLCPLTGRPVHAAHAAVPARSVDVVLPAGAAADATGAAASEDEPICPVTRRHCSCPQANECPKTSQCPQHAAPEKPAETPNQNP